MTLRRRVQEQHAPGFHCTPPGSSLGLVQPTLTMSDQAMSLPYGGCLPGADSAVGLLESLPPGALRSSTARCLLRANLSVHYVPPQGSLNALALVSSQAQEHRMDA